MVGQGLARITRDQYWMQLAGLAASRATCSRRAVGAVIVTPQGTVLLGTGYNGAPHGMPHCGDFREHPVLDDENHCPYSIHAELNAILHSHGASLQGATIYTTSLPCLECAKVILTVGIKEVKYRDLYADRRFQYLWCDGAIPYLQDAGIHVVQVLP